MASCLMLLPSVVIFYNFPELNFGQYHLAEGYGQLRLAEAISLLDIRK